MKEKIVVVGAGSAMFTRGIIRDAIIRNQELVIGLVDTDPEALLVAEKLTAKMIAANKAPITVKASTDIRQILPGATVVISSIGVGGRRAWEQDIAIPRKYGIFQPVADSVMPGGVSRALRMIPATITIMEHTLDLAPQALIFSYANPMSAVCRAAHKATGAPVIGLCIGVVMTAQYLAHQLGVALQELFYNAVGINHCAWFTEVRVNGRDQLPALKEIGRKKLSEIRQDILGAHFPEAGNLELAEETDNPFSWQLLERFGAFPAPGDRHVTEFFPTLCSGGNYFGKKLGVDAFSMEHCIAFGDKIYDQMKADAFSKQPLAEDYFEKVSGEHEQALDIVDSIRTNAGRIYSASLPNLGQIPGLPLGAYVEAPAIADASGIRHLAQKPLPPALIGLSAPKFACVETIVEAALEGSREKFIQALILDGWVSSMDMAAKLADELLAAQAPYLPQFRKSAAL